METSNSRLLIKKYDFDGLLIEPYPPAFEKLKELYQNQRGITLCSQAIGATSHEGVINWHGHFQNRSMPIHQVNEILKSFALPQEIGFLSIDIDGQDNEVLQSVDWRRFRPWIVIAEIDSSSHANLQQQIAIMDHAEYHPMLHIGNVFYVRKDLAGQYFFNWKTTVTDQFGLFRT